MTAASPRCPVGDQPDQLGVNLSAAYLAGGTAVPDVEEALRASGLPAERLVLEITEAAAGSPLDSVALDLTALRLMGVSVALDDFGTRAVRPGLAHPGAARRRSSSTRPWSPASTATRRCSPCASPSSASAGRWA